MGRVKKWGFGLLIVVNLALFAFLLYLLGGRPIAHPAEGWNWTDFITVQLAVVTVVLGVLALFVAVAAVWGYNELRGGAERISHRTAEDFLQSAVFIDMVGKVVRQSITAEAIRAAVARAETGTAEEPPAPDTRWED